MRPTVALGDVAAFVRGVTFKPEDVAPPDSNAIVACMRTKNVQERLDTTDVWGIPRALVRRADQYLMSGDTLVSSANSWNLVGKCCLVPALDESATFGGFVSVLRADEEQLEPRYLFRWFSSPSVQQLVRSFGRKTTSISNLDLARCLRLEMPLPALDEQRRIARVLDAADALRVKRRRAIEHAALLSGAAFSALFEPPVARARRARLGELLERIESGRSPVCAARPAVDDEWGVLKLGAISYGTYRPLENKALLPGCTYKPEHEVRDGDVLLTRKNTRELVGSSVLVRSTPPRRLLPDLMFRLVPAGDSGLRPAYLQAALARLSVRASIARLAGGSAGSMPNISKERLRSVEIVVPPLAAQLEYETILSMHGALTDRLQHHLGQLETLFASLQHRAFTGAL